MLALQVSGRFHLEMVLLANPSVNLRVHLCGDLQIASAQTLDLLALGQKSSFPDWKLDHKGKSFPETHSPEGGGCRPAAMEPCCAI
ncbi:hypothetical protein [Desulfatiglans anilini]|uniref:hypothetical protein n=1 Tax=Desulfatiglans anilini TaxID=90728 RepID=UPI001294866D|nr:hypothetical protein [Desulfatiglans anilini]